MPVVNFQGQQFNFPEGTTQEQIGTALTQYMEQSPLSQTMPSIDSDANMRTEDVSRVPSESYLQEGEESITTPIHLNPQQQQFADNIAQIETGGLENRSVRTQVRPNGTNLGSSAYGKYQITHGLLRGVTEQGLIPFNGQEQAAIEELMARQKISLSIGGRDRVNYQQGGSKYGIAQKWAKDYGYEDVESFLNDFDYGGTLGLADDGDFQVLYESVARKLLNHHLKEAGGDMIAAAGVWHGGPKGAGKSTETYKQKMRRLMENANGS